LSKIVAIRLIFNHAPVRPTCKQDCYSIELLISLGDARAQDGVLFAVTCQVGDRPQRPDTIVMPMATHACEVVVRRATNEVAASTFVRYTRGPLVVLVERLEAQVSSLEAAGEFLTSFSRGTIPYQLELPSKPERRAREFLTTAWPGGGRAPAPAELSALSECLSDDQTMSVRR
jgi:hypothetical protein